jgi:predicted amidophosphoribosyltransferase
MPCNRCGTRLGAGRTRLCRECSRDDHETCADCGAPAQYLSPFCEDCDSEVEP